MSSVLTQRPVKVPPIWNDELVAGVFWKRDILIYDLEDLEMVDASDVYPRRINAKEVLIRQ